MNSFVRPFCGTLVLLNIACAAPEITEPSGAIVPITRFRSEPYSFAFYSGFDKPARLAVRDALTWQMVWTQIYQGQSPTPPLPPIDFSRDMIIVAALGARSTGGYRILIDEAHDAANNAIEVAIRSVSPGPSCPVTEAFTQPIDVARMPRSNAAVHFVESTDVAHCG
ncbi:MAG: protease complex subunit PrcB family protein [Gemmatimonadaceae bacterium]